MNEGSSFRAPRNQPSPTWYRSRAVLGALTYIVLILIVSGYAGYRLHDWARQHILNSSQAFNDEAITATLRRAAELAGRAAQQQPAQEESAAPQLEATPTPAPKAPPINILLMGTDARPDEQGPPLTDTLILLTLDLESQTAGMLSLPRDLWVPIPGQGVSTKINTAYRIGEVNGYPGGGAQLAKDTVGGFIGQEVQYYVRIGFDGFTEIVDLIGGVDVEVSQTIHDIEYPTMDYGVETFHLDAGVHHLDGQTALKFVRTRHTDSDYGRARRQQQLIRAMSDKVLSADMIPTLIANVPQLLSTMRNSFQTDMPIPLALELANYLRDSSLGEIRQLVLDANYGEETYTEQGAWILLPDRAKVRAALNTFFSPAPLATALSSAGGDPSWVRVEILNGTGEPGVAARTRDLLVSHGWQVVSIGDADRNDYGNTLIINYGVPQGLVERVSQDLNLRPDLSSLDGLNISAPIDMRIVVGRDFLPVLQ